MIKIMKDLESQLLMKKNKLTTPIVAAIIFLIIGLIITAFVSFSPSSGQVSAALITDHHIQETVTDHTQDIYKNKDQKISQLLHVKVLHGRYAGRHYTVHNSYSPSQLMTQKYQARQRVLVSFNQSHLKLLSPKRDWVLVLTLTLTIALMILVTGKHAFWLLGAMLVNCALFYGVIKFDIAENGTQIFAIYGVAALLFSFLSLALVQGFCPKMWATWAATVIGVSISFSLCYAVMRLTHENGIKYEAVEYATQDPRALFLAQMILGVLGAVMDEATDIISSLYALTKSQKDITQKQLWQSGRTLGQEIMGPLINVLVLIFMAEALPMTILFLRDNNTMAYTFQFALSLGVVQSLVSAIGIVLIIPTASLCSFVFLRHSDSSQRKGA